MAHAAEDVGHLVKALESIREIRGMSQWACASAGDAAEDALREQYRREIVRAADGPRVAVGQPRQ